jgi:hypothetical protein
MEATLQPERPPVEIDLELHAGQEEVYGSPARFRVVACGRRWGKTTLAHGEVIVYGATNPGSVIWWVAPTYQQSMIAFRMLLATLPPSLREVNRSDKVITLWNGTRISIKSGDRFDHLRGEGVDFLVLDEAAFLREEAWHAALRPTLSDKLGSALLIGTFDGENWFYDAYEMGQSPEHPEWASWRKPTVDNPHIAPSEVEAARRTLPKAVFEQEYLANPLSYVGAVFDGELVQRAIERGRDCAPLADDPRYAGLDWGYTNETALQVCAEDAEGRVAWIDERMWTATELNVRCERIAALCRTHGVLRIMADAAGATENRTLAETLKRHGLKTRVLPVPFGKYKEAAINTRRWYLEQGLEAITERAPKLAAETKRYRYKEESEDILKEDDHGVDAATAFYATRADRMMRAKTRERAGERERKGGGE